MNFVLINEERCKGCGYCILACNSDCLSIGESNRNKNGYSYVVFHKENRCKGCAMCARVCPDAALEIYCREEQI